MERNLCPECKMQINENMRVCPKCGYPLDEEYAELKRKEGKAFHQAKIIILVTGVFIISLSIVLHLIGSFQAKKRINLMEKEIRGTVFEENYQDDGDTFDRTIKFSSDDNTATISGEYWFGGSRHSTNSGNIKYKCRLDFWGIEYIDLSITWDDDYDDEPSIWKEEIGRNKNGNIIVLGKGEDGFYKVSFAKQEETIIYKNHMLYMIFTIMVGLSVIIAVYSISKFYRIKRKNNKWENEKKKKEKEKERNLLIQKKAEKEQTLQNEWNQYMLNMGYNKNDVIRVSFGNLVWVAKEKFCEAENSKDYIQRYLESDKSEHKIQIEAIPVKDIQYFSKEGDVQYTTRVSGGGGGGSSVGGAIVGGLIAGDAGAVIGSRKQTEAIKSEVVTHDSRKTIIRYYKENQIFAITYSGFSVYEYLLTKIPEKDLLTIQLNANKNSTSVKQVEESKKVITAAGNIKEKLETIKNLYDSGLITEEEYAKKKDDILSKI